jgi:hypothetical protein
MSTQTATTAVEYVLADVLGERRAIGSPEVGPFRATMVAAGVTTINDFLMLEYEDIRDLDVEIVRVVTAAPVKKEVGSPLGVATKPTAKAPVTTTTVTRKLTAVERRKLLRLQTWYVDYGASNPTVKPVSRWFQLTATSFNEWNATYHTPSVVPATVGGGTGNPVTPGGLLPPNL